MRSAPRISLCAVLLVAGGLCACASNAPAPTPTRAVREPIVAGAKDGLEIHRWVVDDRDQAVARALGSIADRPVPFDDETVRRLRNNGIRVLACTPAEADALLGALRPVAPVQRQWCGMLYEWTELIAGPTQTRIIDASTDTGQIELAPGRLRLLARCWEVLAPGADTPTGAVRTEFIVQHELSAKPDPLRAALLPERTIADEGVTFQRLYATWLSDDAALVIVADRPGNDWSDLPPPFQPKPEPKPEPGPDPEQELPPAELASGANRVGVFGPSPAQPPTLGELMLIGRDLTASAIPGKVVLVLIPHAPSTYRLSPG